MLEPKFVLFAAAIIAAAILFQGYGDPPRPRYQISAAGADGQTVWRIDMRTGAVSLCGSMINGAALSAVRGENDATLARVLKTNEGMSEFLRDSANVEMVARPRCSSWSAAE